MLCYAMLGYEWKGVKLKRSIECVKVDELYELYELNEWIVLNVMVWSVMVWYGMK